MGKVEEPQRGRHEIRVGAMYHTLGARAQPRGLAVVFSMVRWSFLIGCFVSWSIASGNGNALVARVYQLAAGAKSAAPAALSAAALAPPLDANISASVQDKVHLDVKIFASVKDEVHLLEDWLEYHSRLFGPHNLYVFDDASQDPKAQLILHTFAGQGVNVIWSETESMQVPVYAGPKRRTLMDVAVKTLSSGSKGLAIDDRKVSSYDVLGEHMRVLVPNAYIIPLDVDEFIAYVGPTDPPAPTERTPTGDNGGIHPSYHNWRVQLNHKGIWDALRESIDRDGNNGYPGYHSTRTVQAHMCDRSLYEYVDRALHLAKADLINPFLEADIIERLAANRRLTFQDKNGKTFIRAGNWEHFARGGHTFLALNKAPFHFSRIVLAHYGDLEGMTKAGIRHKLEQRFVQTNWHIRLNLSMYDVKDLSGLDIKKRRGIASQYCEGLVQLHQGKIVFRECTASF